MRPKLFFNLLIGSFFCTANYCFAQPSETNIPNLTNVIPPSPTVAAMQKYGDVPVSLYNGIPDISIPLYTIKSHDITVPISVSYHASGIKVAQDASNVGLGWVLNAGGAISRKIIGFDDFQSGAYFTASPMSPDLTAATYTPRPAIQVGDTLNKGLTNQLSLANTLAAQATYDFEPDQYYYNLPNGKSGRFMLLRNYAAVLQSPERMDITVQQDPANGQLDGNAWQIKTVDGYTYTFSQFVESYTASGVPNVNHMTAVYLTKVTSPTNNTVTFHYSYTNPGSGSGGVVTVPGSYSQTRDDRGPEYASGYNMQPITAVNQQGPGQNFICWSLSYIDFDSGQVQFTYNYNRQDVTNDNQLSSISVYAKDNNGNLLTTPLKTYTFAYNIFDGFTPPAANTYNPNLNIDSNYVQRMMLQSITESGTYNGQSVTLPPYKFTYYTGATSGVDLPLKDSFAIDHWGYYNGMTSNTSYIPHFYQVNTSTFAYFEGITGNQREVNAANPNTNYMQAWSLSDITYPTGGSTHFDYEPNDCDEQKSEVNDIAGYNYNYTLLTSPNAPYPAAVWSSGSPNTQLPILDLTDEFQDPQTDNYVIPDTVKMTYVLSQPLPPQTSFSQNTAGIKIYVYDPATGGPTGSPVATFDPVLDAPGGNPVVSGGAITDVQAISLPPNKYVIQPYASTSSNKNYSYYISDISFPFGSWFTEVNSSPPTGVTNPVTYAQAGGLRIKRITENDGIHAPKIKRYIYHYTLNGLTLSYGRRMSRPRYTYWESSEDIFTINDVGNNSYQFIFLPDHTMRVSNSIIPLDGSASGAVVGYDQVTENIGENGEGGYSVYKYYNNPDTIPQYFYNPYTTGPNLPRYRPYNSNLNDPLNGSLLEQTDYKPGGQPVRDVLNTYQKVNEGYIYAIEDHIAPHFAITIDAGSEIIVYGTGSWSNTIYNDPLYPNPAVYQTNGATDRFLYTYPTIRPFWTFLQSSTVTNYSVTDPTKYEQDITNYYYDNAADFMLTRVSRFNSKNEMVTTHTSYPLDFSGSTATDPVSEGIKNQLTNHVYDSPVEVYTQISAADGATNSRVVSGVLNQYQSSGSPTLNQIYELQTAMPITGFSAFSLSSPTMNSAYQPLIQFGTNYDANGNLLQQNKYQDISHSYKWAYHKDYPIAECKNATANEFFFDSFEDDGTLSTVITPSYGAHTGEKASTATTVSWTVPDSRSYVITYWYYNTSTSKWVFVPEQPYTGNTFTLTMPNAAAYDDIRIFPSDAQITTYTYDPLVGMTSSTDAKGMPTYFEYDGMQRLMNIKDKDGNIIKNYKYYYQPQ